MSPCDCTRASLCSRCASLSNAAWAAATCLLGGALCVLAAALAPVSITKKAATDSQSVTARSSPNHDEGASPMNMSTTHAAGASAQEVE